MTVFYCDLSHHDWDRVKGELNFGSIRSATSPVVSIRATYGDPSGWTRPTYHFRDMATAAKAAGFSMVGGYHNLVTGDAASMRRQVDWLRRELDAVGGSWAMADVERYSELMTSGMFPRWSDVLRFQDAWYTADSRVMAWYLPRWVWARTDMGSPDLSRLQGPLVASRYPTTVDGSPATVYRAAGGDTGDGWDSYGGKAPAIWQFSSTVNVAGASGNTDVNAFRGSLAELTALLTGDDMAYTDAQMQAFPWQYDGRGIGDNDGTTVKRSTLSYFSEMLQLVRKIATQVDIDPAELAAIEQAAAQGAREGVQASVDTFVAAVVAKLPPTGLTAEQVEAAVREVFADAGQA